ncbi:MAG: Fe-S cluster assembly protein SufD [Acidobacteria bacterium]|nr:Fe-S cluster assembly protein SufD [Acidobacteriota bacterium]
MAIRTAEQLHDYLSAFDELRARTQDQPRWLRERREQAFAEFFEKGFPTTKDEDWRFTNISLIAKTHFRTAGEARKEVSPERLAEYRVPGAACQLVLVNGVFSAELSDLGNLPAGVEVTSLSQAITAQGEALARHLGTCVNIHRDAFSALNTAFIEKGAYVYVPRRTVLAGPICLLFVSVPGDSPEITQLRNLILAEEQTEASVVEDYVTLGSGVGFSNVVTELVAGENATISHYLIERESKSAINVSTLAMRQARNANLSSHSVLLGGRLVRNNVHPVLAGDGGECLINGLFIGSGTQHMDNYMLVEHASPHSSSRQFYNGILDDHSHGVFHGRIIVHRDAQKTDAKQTNRNLLLSDHAQVDTKPQLEIYADDVKCTHGATIGQVEENALFYLRSRGIDEDSARRLLLLAFANECLERMKNQPIRDYLKNAVQHWLPVRSSHNTMANELARTWEEVG